MRTARFLRKAGCFAFQRPVAAGSPRVSPRARRALQPAEKAVLQAHMPFQPSRRSPARSPGNSTILNNPEDFWSDRFRPPLSASWNDGRMHLRPVLTPLPFPVFVFSNSLFGQTKIGHNADHADHLTSGSARVWEAGIWTGLQGGALNQHHERHIVRFSAPRKTARHGTTHAARICRPVRPALMRIPHHEDAQPAPGR